MIDPEPLSECVAVVVLNWNGFEDTVAAIESLLRQRCRAKVEIHVVDNASAGGEADRLAARFGDAVRLYRNAENLGFTGGNNVAMSAAVEGGADFVALLNNDAVAREDWLERLLEVARVDVQVGLVASTMVFFDDPDTIENTGVELLTSGQAVPRQRGRPSHAALESSHPIGACGGAVLYRAKMLEQIGRFENSFFANFEDVELSLRALASGWDVRFAPRAVVRHRLSRSIAKVRDDSFLLRSQRNNLWAIWARLPWQVLLLNFPSIVAGETLLLVGSPLCGQWHMAKILWISRVTFVCREVGGVFQARRRFASQRDPRAWRRILQRQSGFVRTYVRSFLDIVVRRRRRFFQ